MLYEVITIDIPGVGDTIRTRHTVVRRRARRHPVDVREPRNDTRHRTVHTIRTSTGHDHRRRRRVSRQVQLVSIHRRGTAINRARHHHRIGNNEIIVAGIAAQRAVLVGIDMEYVVVASIV